MVPVAVLVRCLEVLDGVVGQCGFFGCIEDAFLAVDDAFYPATGSGYIDEI